MHWTTISAFAIDWIFDMFVFIYWLGKCHTIIMCQHKCWLLCILAHRAWLLFPIIQTALKHDRFENKPSSLKLYLVFGLMNNWSMMWLNYCSQSYCALKYKPLRFSFRLRIPFHLFNIPSFSTKTHAWFQSNQRKKMKPDRKVPFTHIPQKKSL